MDPLDQILFFKALKVTSLEKYKPTTFPDNVLSECKYFRVEKLNVTDSYKLNADEKSFHCITCVGGRGELNGQTVLCGDSFFVPAGYGEYELLGDMEIILTTV